MSSFPPRPPARRCWLLLVFLLLLSGPLAAQSSRRYWEANPDSLLRVLATQHADTARLRTLLHLYDTSSLLLVGLFNVPLGPQLGELVQLTRRQQRPDAPAFRLSYAAVRLAQAEPARALDSMRAAVEVFDRVGRPIPFVLAAVASYFRRLKQRAAQTAYFEAKLARYQARGARENTSRSYHALGGPFLDQGDYNRAISHYLRAADLAVTYDRLSQENELKVVGSCYAEWGNSAKALYYLRKSLAVHRSLLAAHPSRYDRLTSYLGYTYRGMAQAYRQLHDYPAALRYARLSGANSPADTLRDMASFVLQMRAHELVAESAVLLDIGRVAEARPLLVRAQHLADSLKMGLFSSNGSFELDATWARYYVARNEPVRAETDWLTAYRKAREAKLVPLRLSYLRALADFYAQRGQTEPAGRYARLGLALSDSLSTQQGAFHVAGYEAERAEQAQQQRIAALRLAQVQDAARARRQRLLLGATLAVLALLAGLGFVLWRANRQKQFANEQLNELNAAVTHQKQGLQTQRDQLDASLTELRTTQAQLIQAEKMASLGELTAGIAHEIQNPLNFVNNFAEVSAELITELEEEQQKPDRDLELEAELLTDLKQNLLKISQHGGRAASIVRGMLEHSRTSSGERTPTNLNQLADEYLRLAYHGLRAKDKTFNATLKPDFDPVLPPVEVIAQDLGRVLLNLLSNAFYAVRQRQQRGVAGYAPTVGISTRRVGKKVEIRVRDNGQGIPEAVRAKIFQPFFTTKPTGEGTGLGLSLSYDIVTQGHGGTLSVTSEEGSFTEFLISLPINQTG
ncbi:ATP-binding protein [Hymenobacter siberiensis]|uniref:ATP-binding protein n=1 Tax=Hymenobacter siberiensis TaxID=2848396 RepID=UPI001D0270C7|nr:ATP-binding protein [Hymenobacter siberiensis]